MSLERCVSFYCDPTTCLTAPLQRADEHTNVMRALQQELEELREDRARDRDREQRRQQEHEEELQILRDRCETLEAERANGGGGVSPSFSPTYLFSHQCAKADPQLLRQLQSDMQGLMEELTERSEERRVGKEC